MANIVVLPTIEIPNPFGVLAEVLGKEVIPFITELSRSKEQIALFSDKELTDHIPVLKRFASDLLTQDGKIDWNKVEEYAKSEDPFKQEVASYLSNVRKMREEFANLPVGEKLEKLSFYATATNPKILEKSFKVKIITEKYNEALDKADIPEELKLFFRAYAPELAEKIAERPELFSSYIKLLENLSKRKQGNTQQGGGTGSWRLSLDGQNKKQFSIRLEEPQLTPPQVSPPQIPKVLAPQPVSPQTPKVVKQKPVVQRGQTGNIGREEQVKQNDKIKTTKEQKPQQSSVMTFWRDGVLWEMRRGKDGKVEYIPREVPLIEQDMDPLTTSFLPSVLSNAGKFISNVFGRVSKTLGRGAQKTAEKVVENVAKETAENTASKQATSPEAETKQTVLTPIKKLESLVKEIPNEAKNDPKIRRRLVEITRDLKKISREAPFRDVSDDLRVLDAKVDELKAFLKKQYGETKTTTEKPTPKTKKQSKEKPTPKTKKQSKEKPTPKTKKQSKEKPTPKTKKQSNK
jgi:hypothetical protein